MAIVQNPIIGRASQKYANAKFSTWKGKNVLSSIPLTFSNPKTEAQRIQRNRFSSLVWLNVWLRAAWLKGFAKAANGKTEYNVFVSENLMTTTSADADNVLPVNAIDLKLSTGSLGMPSDMDAAQNTTMIDLTWSTAPIYPTDSDNDRLVIVFMRQLPATPIQKGSYIDTVQVVPTLVTRDMGSVSISLDIPHAPGDVIVVHTFFYSDLSKEASYTVSQAITWT